MARKSIITLLVVGALSAVAVLGAFTFRTVYAQEETPTTPTQPLRQWGGWQGDRSGEMGQELADALGIDLADLQAAQATAFDEALKQAVEQGLITQAQADQIKARGFGFRGMHLPGLASSSIDTQALLAKALGITVEKLEAAQQQVFKTRLDQAVANGALTQEQADLMLARKALFGSDAFQSSMQSAFEAAVQQGVASGLITQAQADQILAEQSGRGFFRGGPGMGGFGGMEGFGGMGGRHGGHRGGGMMQPQTDDTSAPTPEGGA